MTTSDDGAVPSTTDGNASFEEMTDDGSSRRSFLTKSAMGVAAASAVWAAPSILTVDAASAATRFAPVLVNVQNNRRSGTGLTTVGGLGLPGVEGPVQAQVAMMLIPIAAGADTITVTVPTAGTGPAWVPIITGYDSTSVVAGTASPPGATARVRMFVWGRVAAVSITDPAVDFSLAGATLSGTWRATVAEFGGVSFIANNAGEAAAIGGGAAATTIVSAPAISNDKRSLILFLGGGDAASAVGTTPPGYALDDFNAFQPVYQAAHLSTTATAIAATAGTFAAATMTVGAQLTIEGLP